MSEKISMNIFSRNSIANAKERLMQIADEVEGGDRLAVKQLTQMGYEYMMTVVKVESGNLADSITWEYDESTNTGSRLGLRRERSRRSGLVVSDRCIRPKPNKEAGGRRFVDCSHERATGRRVRL